MTRFEMPVDANYDVYLQRMDLSAERSSKGLIPRLAIGRALDIGCGSGVLLRSLKNAKGIDLNPKAVAERMESVWNISRAKCSDLFVPRVTKRAYANDSVLAPSEEWAREHFNEIMMM